MYRKGNTLVNLIELIKIDTNWVGWSLRSYSGCSDLELCGFEEHRTIILRETKLFLRVDTKVLLLHPGSELIDIIVLAKLVSDSYHYVNTVIVKECLEIQVVKVGLVNFLTF
jgi:hypothetical protein